MDQSFPFISKEFTVIESDKYYETQTLKICDKDRETP